ncbi:MAG: ERF family protein, partial [Candidatus Peribacteraceae bacterium]|nr:ERF family protein [Candidatus Peribacteraceae bacterium]
MPELPVAHSKKYMPEIQAKVKIDKGHYNDYSGFWFRTAEDVLEVVKPVLKEYDAYITLNDDVVSFDNGSRVYIKVTATVAFLDGSNVKAVGFSREPLNRPGFDESQLTGSSSSYARKTALSGLFAIDNAVTDADSDNKDTPPEKTEGKTDSKRGKRAKTDDKAKDKAESKLETYPTDKFKVD